VRVLGGGESVLHVQFHAQKKEESVVLAKAKILLPQKFLPQADLGIEKNRLRDVALEAYAGEERGELRKILVGGEGVGFSANKNPEIKLAYVSENRLGESLALSDIKALPPARKKKKTLVAFSFVVADVGKAVKKAGPKISGAFVLSVPLGHRNLNAVPVQIFFRRQVEVLRVKEGREVGVFLDADSDVDVKGGVGFGAKGGVKFL